MSKIKPTPLFDSLQYFLDAQSYHPAGLKGAALADYEKTLAFLFCYRANKTTFNAYRREVERFLHWCQLRANKTLRQIRRGDFEDYVNFCLKPPKSWIGLKKETRFIVDNGQRIPNKKWHPFVVTVSKSETRNGKIPDKGNYALSEKSIREIFAIIGSFFNFLIQEDYTQINPVLQVKQKSQYFRKSQSKQKIRRLSELQWGYVIETVEMMANENPIDHERTLFIMSGLYSMYLRISELAASDRWIPQMGDFKRDADGLWWFTTVGKGNKERQITVSLDMVDALKRYRKSLDLTPLPSPNEQTPLIRKVKGQGPIQSTRHIRLIVQKCFDKTIYRLNKDGLSEDAEQLSVATVHWLRHTGISDDVKHRPREHVRDDAGHSSSAITDKYIDIERRERHRTARRKKIKPELLEDG